MTDGGLSALHGKVAQVELIHDGTFIAHNIPARSVAEAPEAGGSMSENLLNASGRWRIAAVGGVDNGLGERTHWGVYLDSTTADIEPAGLIGARPPYGLILTFGDPDLGHAMVFARQN